MKNICLERFNNGDWSRGKPALIEAIWMVLSVLFVSSWLPGSAHRRWLLVLFGARIGTSVVLKPGLRVKFPWRLDIGDHSWIGEDVWIDNLALVKIGSNACISQGAYLCTGSHDWSSPTFDLIVKPITIGDGAWVAAKSTVGPGVIIGEGAVLGLGSTTSKDLEPWCVYAGSPAEFVRKRTLRPAVPV
jgi:putative colanic acid biosynthesis acetyltransferase WcaF